MAEGVIFAGDTLSKIGNLIGSSVDEILIYNPSIKDKNKIFVGQKLIVPDTELGKKWAAGRRSAWADMNTKVLVNTPEGNWGVYQETVTKYPPVPQPTNGTGINPQPLAVPQTNNFSSLIKNPFILGGIALVILALTMGKK